MHRTSGWGRGGFLGEVGPEGAGSREVGVGQAESRGRWKVLDWLMASVLLSPPQFFQFCPSLVSRRDSPLSFIPLINEKQINEHLLCAGTCLGQRLPILRGGTFVAHGWVQACEILIPLSLGWTDRAGAGQGSWACGTCHF